MLPSFYIYFDANRMYSHLKHTVISVQAWKDQDMQDHCLCSDQNMHLNDNTIAQAPEMKSPQ